MNEEEKKAIEYYQDKEISFSVDFNTAELLKALGITETEEDSFKNHQIRFRTLLNLIEKLQKENEELKSIELKSKGGAIKISLEGVLSLENKIKQLEKENEELKRLMTHKNGYTKLLEEDLFENCENFVISKDKIKEQIKKYAKLSDDFYEKWKNLSPFDEDYKNIRNKGMCCDAIINALQELLKG